MHVGHFLTRAAQRYPDRPAWLEGDVRISFREAEARVNRLAHPSYKKPQSVADLRGPVQLLVQPR